METKTHIRQGMAGVRPQEVVLTVVEGPDSGLAATVDPEGLAAFCWVRPPCASCVCLIQRSRDAICRCVHRRNRCESSIWIHATAPPLGGYVCLTRKYRMTPW